MSLDPPSRGVINTSPCSLPHQLELQVPLPPATLIFGIFGFLLGLGEFEVVGKASRSFLHEEAKRSAGTFPQLSRHNRFFITIHWYIL